MLTAYPYADTQPFACDYCRNRNLECRYFRGAVGGRCNGCHKGHGICTLNTKSLTTGKPMKGPAAERKAVAFHQFIESLRANGKPIPTLALWDPRRDSFIVDLETFDGYAEGAHPDLVAWVRARNRAIAAGKSLPEYTADREPKKGRSRRKKVEQDEEAGEAQVVDEMQTSIVDPRSRLLGLDDLTNERCNYWQMSHHRLGLGVERIAARIPSCSILAPKTFHILRLQSSTAWAEGPSLLRQVAFVSHLYLRLLDGNESCAQEVRPDLTL